MALTGDKIKTEISKKVTAGDFAEALAKAIVNNLEVSIPIGKVIVKVSGGSGLPAIGIKNIKVIKCKVK